MRMDASSSRWVNTYATAAVAKANAAPGPVGRAAKTAGNRGRGGTFSSLLGHKKESPRHLMVAGADPEDHRNDIRM